MKRQHGAALMVMLLVAGVVGSVFVIQLAGRTAAERAHVTATTLALTQAREALIGFAVINGRLPRPSVSGVNGIEQAANCATDALCKGTLPWATLGVTKLDSWGKSMGYSVSKAYSEPGLVSATVPTKKVQTRNAAGALVFVKGTAAACVAAAAGPTDVATDCAPAVLFSFGKANFGMNDVGAVVANLSGPPVTNLDEVTNSGAATLTFVQRATSDNTAAPGGEFDDIVIWLSPNILFKRMLDAGRTL